MKRITILAMFALAIFASSCKTQKIASSKPVAPAPEPTTVAPAPIVQQQTYTQPETTTTYPTAGPGIRAEKFEVVDTDRSANRSYYIIVGSFKSFDNAKNLKSSLMSDGYAPSILMNEAGMYRVAIASYMSENDARSKKESLRQDTQKFGDAWLLIQKR